MSTAIAFEDVAGKAGVRFTHRNSQDPQNNAILDSLGGGAAALDFDLDGQLDLLFTGGGSHEGQKIIGAPAGLFRQTGPWQFTDITKAAHVDAASHYSHGVAIGDYNSDGFPDVLITGYGGLTLFSNQGDGTFVDRTSAAGLADKLWSSSAAWGDLNGDGLDDLYVAHYVDWSWQNHPFCEGDTPEHRETCPPRLFNGLPDSLYINRGDGAFVDSAKDLGLRPDGKGLGVLLADFNLDGRLDVYVANDTVPNFFYINTGNGHFSEQGLSNGTSLSELGSADGSMGIDLGDYDLDGQPDLWVVNYEHETFALYRNQGTGLYEHASQNAGIAAVAGQYVGWGTSFCDFDCDGDEDIFVSNGHVIRYPKNTPLRQLPLVFENRGGHMQNIAAAAGSYTGSPRLGRGLAVGDFDGDGRPDLAISLLNEPVALLQNRSQPVGHWLGVRLIGRNSARDAVGARVEIRTATGQQSRQRKGGGSYASTNSPILHFGLGKATEVSELIVHWPSGQSQRLASVAADQAITIIEPK